MTWLSGSSAYNREKQIFAISNVHSSISYTFLSSTSDPIQKTITIGDDWNLYLSTHTFLETQPKSIVFFINTTAFNEIASLYSVDLETMKVESMYHLQAPKKFQFLENSKITIDEENKILYTFTQNTWYNIAAYDLTDGSLLNEIELESHCDYFEYHSPYLYCAELYGEWIFLINPKTGITSPFAHNFCSSPAWLPDTITFDFVGMKTYVVSECDSQPTLVTIDLVNGFTTSLTHPGLNYYSRIHPF